MKIIATKMPSGVNATLMPSSAQRRAEPALLREQRRQRDAGDRGRQRKGNIDDGVEQPAARKAIAHQRPDDDQCPSPD